MIPLFVLAGMWVSVDAGDAAQTITEMSRQVHVQMLFDYALIKDHQTNPVHGNFTPPQAFEALLANSGLQYEYVNSRTLTVTNPPQRHFSIPAGSACAALLEWYHEANIGVLWLATSTFCTHVTKGVEGDFRSLDALGQMVAGSGLTFMTYKDGSVILHEAQPPHQAVHVRRASPILQAVSHECTCAQTWDGSPIGHWCYEGAQIAYSQSCGVATQ